MNINKAMSICFRNKIKVYPVLSKKTKLFRIAVSVFGKEKVIRKDITQKEINNSMTKTYIYYAKKL